MKPFWTSGCMVLFASNRSTTKRRRQTVSAPAPAAVSVGPNTVPPAVVCGARRIPPHHHHRFVVDECCTFLLLPLQVNVRNRPLNRFSFDSLQFPPSYVRGGRPIAFHGRHHGRSFLETALTGTLTVIDSLDGVVIFT